MHHKNQQMQVNIKKLIDATQSYPTCSKVTLPEGRHTRFKKPTSNQ